MSGSKVAVALLLFLVGGGLGYLLLQDDGDPGPGVEIEITERGSGETPIETSPIARSQGGAVVDPLRPAPITTEAYRGEPPAPDEIGLGILVRDEEERPVKGATLRLLHPWATSDDQESRLPGYAAWEARSGANGVARVRDLPTTPFRAVARHGDRLGHINVEPESLSLPAREVIDLKPLRHAEVTVVDRAGEAVAHARVIAGSPNFMQPGLSGWTAEPSGVVAFEISSLDPAYEDGEFAPRVRLDVGSFAAESVPWNEEGVTRARIEVDRGVTLEVTVFGEDGHPHPDQKTLKWKTATTSDTGEDDILVIALPERAQGRRRSFAGGVVRVAGLKPSARVEVTVEEPERCPVKETVELPPLETLHALRLDRGDLAPRLEIPVVDAAGSAVSQERFEVEVTYDRENRGTEAVKQMVFLTAPTMTAQKDLFTPDAEGLITYFVEPYRSGRVKVKRFRPGSEGPYGSMRMMWAGGEPGENSEGVAFPRLAPGATHRLARVAMPNEEVVASGRVLDAAGKAVPGAFVQVLRSNSGGPDRMSRAVRVVDADGLRTRCEADGSFVLRAREGQSVPSGPLLYAHRAEEAISEMVPFKPGDTGIELRLKPAGALEGVVRSALPRARAWIRLEPRSGAGLMKQGRINPLLELSKRVEGDGTFALSGLPAGTYDAIVSLFNFEVLVARGVVIRGGETTRDPRLDGVTVGQDVIEAVISVRDPGGAPIEDAVVRLETIPPGATERQRMHQNTDAEGRAAIHLHNGSRADATVDADGYRKWSGKDVTFPLDVVLDPGCRLEVVIDNPAELRTDEGKRLYEIEISARKKVGTNFRTSRLRSKRLDVEEGTVAFGGLAPGDYVATLNAGRTMRIEGGDFLISTMTGRGPATQLGVISIREGERTRQLRCRLTPEQLTKLEEK